MLLLMKPLRLFGSLSREKEFRIVRLLNKGIEGREGGSVCRSCQAVLFAMCMTLAEMPRFYHA